MGNTEKVVAFRKRRRDYALRKTSNPIRDGTTVTVVKQDRFYRAETILGKTRQIKADKRKYEQNLKRKECNNFPQPGADLKYALVVRIAETRANLCQESKAVLDGFKLKNQFDGCFVALNEENRTKLKSISHLIAYGTPSTELLRQLIHNNSTTVVNGKEEHITSNKMITDALGDKKIICLDDIVYAFVKGADTIEDITKFLAPFHFNKTELTNVKLPKYSGGPSGWRGDEITQFVETII